MPAPAHLPPAPLALHGLMEAWQRGQDLGPALEAIDWETPVFVWGAPDSPGAGRTGSLVHPLSLVFHLGDPGLSARVVGHKLDHPWSDLPITQAHVDVRQPLPPLSDLWQWGLLEAAIAAKAWEAAALLMPRVLQDVAHHRHPGTAAAQLCAVVGQVPDFPAALALWQAMGSAQHEEPHVRAFRRNQVLEQAARLGHPDLVEALAAEDPAGVRAVALAWLTHRGHFGHAHRLGQQALACGKDFCQDPDLPKWVEHVVAWVKPAPAAEHLAHAAGMLASIPPLRALLVDPGAREGHYSAPPLAHAVADLVRQLPAKCLRDMAAQSRGMSLEIVRAWARHGTNSPADPAIAPWVAAFTRHASQAERHAAFEAFARVAMGKEGAWLEELQFTSRPGKEEALDVRVACLGAWATGLGLELEPALGALSTAILEPLLRGLGQEAWQQALARHRQVALDQRLAASAPGMPRARM